MKGPENPGVVAPLAAAGCRGNRRYGTSGRSWSWYNLCSVPFDCTWFPTSSAYNAMLGLRWYILCLSPRSSTWTLHPVFFSEAVIILRDGVSLRYGKDFLVRYRVSVVPSKPPELLDVFICDTAG